MMLRMMLRMLSGLIAIVFSPRGRRAAAAPANRPRAPRPTTPGPRPNRVPIVAGTLDRGALRALFAEVERRDLRAAQVLMNPRDYSGFRRWAAGDDARSAAALEGRVSLWGAAVVVPDAVPRGAVHACAEGNRLAVATLVPGETAGGQAACPDCGEADAGDIRCRRCDTWTCGACAMEGMCGNCFAKMQGGVR